MVSFSDGPRLLFLLDFRLAFEEEARALEAASEAWDEELNDDISKNIFDQKRMESTNLGCDMTGRFRAGRRDPAAGAEATVLDSWWVGAVEVVRCLLVFLGGEPV